jgi:hypothetical protein
MIRFSQNNYHEDWPRLLVDSFLWLVFLLSILVSTLFFALVCHVTISADWEIAKLYSDSIASFFLIIFPIKAFVVALITLFIACLSYFSLMRRSFYRLKPLIIVIFLSLAISLGACYLDISRSLENLVLDSPSYLWLMGDRDRVWQAAEKGLLSGTVATIESTDSFILAGFDGKTWNLGFASSAQIDSSLIYPGNKLRLIGRITDTNHFEAQKILSYEKD